MVGSSWQEKMLQDALKKKPFATKFNPTGMAGEIYSPDKDTNQMHDFAIPPDAFKPVQFMRPLGNKRK